MGIGGSGSKSESSSKTRSAPKGIEEVLAQKLGLQMFVQAARDQGLNVEIQDRDELSEEMFGKPFAKLGRKKQFEVNDALTTNVDKIVTEEATRDAEFLETAKARERGLLENPESLISDSARGLVDTAFEGPAQTARDQLHRTAVNAAGRRGLNLSDTPISAPLLRSSRDLEASIAAAKAGALLTGAQQEREFISGLRALEETTKQQDFVNLLNLGGGTGQFGIGLQQSRGVDTKQTASSSSSSGGFGLGLSGGGGKTSSTG